MQSFKSNYKFSELIYPRSEYFIINVEKNIGNFRI